MDIQTVGRDCVALNVHSRVSGAREAASLLEPWPRMELELFPSCGGTLIVARPSEGLAVEVADYALPFLRGN